jgi:type I restriction enzyme M protein
MRITRHPAAGLLRQIVICFPFVAAGFKNYIYKGAGMVTGTIKNKVDKIWTDIWAGGITNPLTVIEQLTYLMFIRSLDEKELEAEDFENTMGGTMDKIFPQTVTGQSMRWSKFKDRDPREIYEILSLRVFPAIKKMKNGHLPDFNDRGELIEVTDENGSEETAFARYMDDAMFLIPTPQVLQKIITGLDDLYENDISDLDMQGDLYEYMLGKLSTAGQNGQFRTPKHIREMMVELVQPTPDDLICDPACGTAGFLVSAAEYVRNHYEDTMSPEQWEHYTTEMFTGYDIDRTMLRISAMNLMLHSISNPDIDYNDSVSKQNQIAGKYTVCLANPPFKGTVDAESINDNLKAVTNTKKTELLFLALFLRLLKKGGRCACIVPDGVLFGSSKAHKSIRQELIENHHLRAVISMPSGVFKPYAGVSTAVLVFTKTGAGGTDQVWFYDMKADGFSLDDKRSEISDNDIPDIINRFRNLEGEKDRKRTDQSFLVPKADIVSNDYDLSINKYKETEYVAVEYPPTEEIMASIDEIELQIQSELEELKKLLGL